MDWPDYDRHEWMQLVAGLATYATLVAVAAFALSAVVGGAVLFWLNVGSPFRIVTYGLLVAYGAGLITLVNYTVFKVIG